MYQINTKISWAGRLRRPAHLGLACIEIHLNPSTSRLLLLSEAKGHILTTTDQLPRPQIASDNN